MTPGTGASAGEVSPRLLSRIGGALYLVIIAIGVSGEMVVRGSVVVPGDAAATAANLGAMESLWRLGIAGEMVLLICGVVLALIFYLLARPVSRDLALLAAFFNLVTLSVEATAALGLAGALLAPGAAGDLGALQPDQLHAMTSLAIALHAHGFAVALIFFGCFCLVYGLLIFRSGYFPKTLGVLLLLAGVCYLTNSFAFLLAPALAALLFPAILVPAFIGELSLALWLLVKGVNLEAWTRVDQGGSESVNLVQGL